MRPGTGGAATGGKERVKKMAAIGKTMTETMIEKVAADMSAAMERWGRPDADTTDHCRRTACLTAGLALQMKLGGEQFLLTVMAAGLHDMGKAGIPEEILNKPGALSSSEMEIIKRHPLEGYQILREDIPSEAADMVLCHHENVDGSGYLGLSQNEIPLGARIIRVCDVYDALISKRAYKEPWSRSRALSYIRENSGSLFDETCADAFCAMMDAKYSERYAEGARAPAA